MTDVDLEMVAVDGVVRCWQEGLWDSGKALRALRSLLAEVDWESVAATEEI